MSATPRERDAGTRLRLRTRERTSDPEMARPSRADVRNPILGLPGIAALRELDPATRRLLQDLLLDLQADARRRAETSWRSRKPPLAAYWAACGVYAGHIARARSGEDRGACSGF